ncbi:arginase family protein [Conexibacter sp. CPCC 206217]|uniref:arginase family protein n=1 Tax=Conexibacter sp. CPCC 206217 TaxID=3064574 RepID=UPI0027253580|nr:arginase family protein [Conexibacter sp. CPCC 206217]MDO8208853.1 arginase family protein [Conexibacter sp. CPCC 206217]
MGDPSGPRQDDWRESLSAANDTLNRLAAAVTGSLREERTPLIVANTCAASLATLPVAATARPGATLLWVDAHGDFNTPGTTASGYLGGMVLAAACGLWDSGHGAGLDPRQVILVGARDIDDAEGRLLAEHGVRIVSPVDAVPEALLPMIGISEVWIHVDWDVLEPGFVPAAYAVPNGLPPQQLKALLAAIAAERIAAISGGLAAV